MMQESGTTSQRPPSDGPSAPADQPQLDLSAMIARFRDRAEAVRKRGIPPVEGLERQRFILAAKLDYQDFAMIADAQPKLEDGILTLRIDLRPTGQ
jgi:hypothetical protein